LSDGDNAMGGNMPSFHRRGSYLPWIAAGLLLLLSLAFMARGLQQLLLPSSSTQAKDLHTNWVELREVVHRQSPYSGAGNVLASPYPPWTFPLSLILYWPPWPIVKEYFAFINIVCLLLLATWAYRVGAGGDARYSVELALSVTAISSIATAVGLGQNTVVYTALLAGALVLYERRQRLLCGVLLGIAMSKINIALPFALPFLFRKEGRVLAAAGAYIIAATLALGGWCHSTPLETMRLWVAAAERYNGVAYGPASLLVDMGVSPDIAARGCAVGVLSLAVIAMAAWRRLPIFTSFGLAAGFGRLWSYHRVYDNFMLVFLLVALADVWIRTRNRSVWVMVLLVGFTLWFPIRSIEGIIAYLIHVVIWSVGIVVLGVSATNLQRRALNSSERHPCGEPTTKATPSSAA
jgi:hypothetical protein